MLPCEGADAPCSCPEGCHACCLECNASAYARTCAGARRRPAIWASCPGPSAHPALRECAAQHSPCLQALHIETGLVLLAPTPFSCCAHRVGCVGQAWPPRDAMEAIRCRRRARQRQALARRRQVESKELWSCQGTQASSSSCQVHWPLHAHVHAFRRATYVSNPRTPPK
eukprot:355656-Chlamydomonas_euryale.AAC.4